MYSTWVFVDEHMNTESKSFRSQRSSIELIAIELHCFAIFVANLRLVSNTYFKFILLLLKIFLACTFAILPAPIKHNSLISSTFLI